MRDADEDIVLIGDAGLAYLFGDERPLGRAWLALPLTVLWPVGAGWTSPELRVVDTPAPVATSPSDTRVGDQTLRDEIAAALRAWLYDERLHADPVPEGVKAILPIIERVRDEGAGQPPTMPFTVGVAGVGQVPVTHDPNLEHRGICDWNFGYDLSARPGIRLREYDERVLLHEVLHAIIGTDPTMPTELRAGQDGHEQLVRRLTRGLFGMGWRWKLRDRTDAQVESDLSEALATIERVRAEALEPILALHRPTKAPGEPEVCTECQSAEYEPAHWPCRTVRAITAAREDRP